MSMMTCPAAGTRTYDPSLFSTSVEQGSLPVELSTRTSSLESGKEQRSKSWRSPLDLSAAKDSFLAFCTEVLQFNNNEDEEDQIATNARDAVLSVTENAYSRLPHKWQRPRVATDGGGGVRLTWKSQGKELRAVFPADNRRAKYLYMEEAGAHSLIPNFTATTLCDQFDWLVPGR